VPVSTALTPVRSAGGLTGTSTKGLYPGPRNSKDICPYLGPRLLRCRFQHRVLGGLLAGADALRHFLLLLLAAREPAVVVVVAGGGKGRLDYGA
jgi:hypothetical protein